MSSLPRAGWLALGALVGACGFEVLPPGGAFAGIGLGIACALALVIAVACARRQTGAAAMLLGFALIVGRGVLGGIVEPSAASGPPPASEVAWLAHVESVGSPAGGKQRAIVLATPREGGTQQRLWMTLPRYPQVIPGDRLGFTARIEPTSGADGFAAYLRRLGAAGTARAATIVVIGRGESPSDALEGLRRTFGDWLARALPEPQAGLASGIVVGLRDRVARDVAADFTTSGLSHIVAISGWNIALVAGAIAALGRRLSRRRRSLLVVGAIIAYSLVAGAGPSVLRAALMAGLALLGRESGRPGRASGMLGLAVVAMLLVDPATIADPGFQLSAAATAGLIAWGAPLSAWLGIRLRGRLGSWLSEALGVSLAAQAATLPLVLLDFGRLSLVAPLANLIAAPLVVPVMASGMAALAAGAVASAGAPPIAVAPIEAVGSVALGSLVAVARASASLPFASVALPGAGGAVGALVAGTCLAVVGTARGRAAVRRWNGAVRRRLARRRIFTRRPGAFDRRSIGPRRPSGARVSRLTAVVLALPLAAVLGGALIVAARADGRLHVTVIDVGQGDAILVEGDRGGRLLVDAGPDADATLAQLDARVPAWDRRIDLVILTHPHEDHDAALALLLGRYRVGAVVEPGMVGPGPGYRAFQEALTVAGRASRQLAAGDRFTLDGATVLVRWPLPGGVPPEPPDTGRGINDVSIVLDIHFGARRMLLMGDVEEDVDPQLLAAGIADGRPLDLLKAAHHGSRTSSTAALLDALRPRVAIVSVGRRNPYGHPSRETLARIEAAGARAFRTDLDGSVEVSTDGHDLRVDAARSSASPAPRSKAAPAGAALQAQAAPKLGAGAALFRCGLATIVPWPSPGVARRPPSFSSSRRPTVSSPMQALSPRWPRSSPPGSAPVADGSISGSWKPPGCSTTSTSCFPATIRAAPSATASAARVGSPSTATLSSGSRSPPTP